MSDTVFVVCVSVLLQSDFSSYIFSFCFCHRQWDLPQLGLRVRLLIPYLTRLLLLFVALVFVICLVYSYCKRLV